MLSLYKAIVEDGPDLFSCHHVELDARFRCVAQAQNTTNTYTWSLINLNEDIAFTFWTKSVDFFQVKYGGIIVEVRITANRRLISPAHIPGALALLVYFHHKSGTDSMGSLCFHRSR